MGGLITGITDALSRALPRLGEGESNEAGRLFNNIFGAKDRFFQIGGAEGKAVSDLHGQYQVARSGLEKQYDAPLKALQVSIDSETSYRKANLNAKNTLGELYKHAVKENHITAQPGGAFEQLIAQGAKYTDTPRSLQYLNIARARRDAGIQVLGANYENLVPHIMDAFDSRDPNRIIWAKGVMDLFSNELHDTKDIYNAASHSVQPGSAVKEAIGKAFAAENRNRAFLSGFGKGKIGQAALREAGVSLPSIDTRATYHAPTKLESALMSIQRTVQLPFVALKHISQYGNLSSIPAPQLVKGLLGMTDPEFKTFLDTTNILAFNEHDIMSRALMGGSSKIAEWTGSPTVGKLLYNSYHMPFFDYLRIRQLSLAASVGYQSAQHWADAAMSGDKRALAELTEMHINPQDVLKQGGKLTDDQLRQGVFHFVNNRFFMDKSIEQAQYSNLNPWMRSATRYHTFVNAQQRFMRRELGKMWKAGDYVGIAQFAGTIGVLYPAVAPMLQGLEVLGRTASPTQAEEKAQAGYQGYVTDPVSTYLEMLAHYASFGVYTSYIQAAASHRLAYQILGPSIGVPARFSEDLLNAVTVTNQAGKHNAAPVVRDLLEDTLPVGGNILAHRVAPTIKEQKPIPRRLRRPTRPRVTNRPWEF